MSGILALLGTLIDQAKVAATRLTGKTHEQADLLDQQDRVREAQEAFDRAKGPTPDPGRQLGNELDELPSEPGRRPDDPV